MISLDLRVRDFKILRMKYRFFSSPATMHEEVKYARIPLVPNRI